MSQFPPFSKFTAVNYALVNHRGTCVSGIDSRGPWYDSSRHVVRGHVSEACGVSSETDSRSFRGTSRCVFSPESRPFQSSPQSSPETRIWFTAVHRNHDFGSPQFPATPNLNHRAPPRSSAKSAPSSKHITGVMRITSPSELGIRHRWVCKSCTPTCSKMHTRILQEPHSLRPPKLHP